MKKLLCLLLLAVSLCCFAQQVDRRTIEGPRSSSMPTFFGIKLPEEGARVLLILDISKSMGLKDALRTDGGRRWDTLLDEVRQMTAQMQDNIRAKPTCYTITVLYEGGDSPHLGTPPYEISVRGAAERLLKDLEARTFVSGGSFEATFGENLWPLVARQNITHIIYLGDNDIAKYEAPIRNAVSAWYALPRKNPEPYQKELYKLKTQWRKGWDDRTAVKARRLPPLLSDVVISCVAIGQPSAFLKELSELGKGSYVERCKKRKKK